MDDMGDSMEWEHTNQHITASHPTTPEYRSPFAQSPKRDLYEFARGEQIQEQQVRRVDPPVLNNQDVVNPAQMPPSMFQVRQRNPVQRFAQYLATSAVVIAVVSSFVLKTLCKQTARVGSYAYQRRYEVKEVVVGAVQAANSAKRVMVERVTLRWRPAPLRLRHTPSPPRRRRTPGSPRQSLNQEMMGPITHHFMVGALPIPIDFASTENPQPYIFVAGPNSPTTLPVEMETDEVDSDSDGPSMDGLEFLTFEDSSAMDETEDYSDSSSSDSSSSGSDSSSSTDMDVNDWDSNQELPMSRLHTTCVRLQEVCHDDNDISMDETLDMDETLEMEETLEMNETLEMDEPSDARSSPLVQIHSSGLNELHRSPQVEGPSNIADEALSSPLSSVLVEDSPIPAPSSKKSPKKSVRIFVSPKTGRPVTRTKKFIKGESIDHPVSSSPSVSSISSSVDSLQRPYDSPTMIEEAAAHAKVPRLQYRHVGEVPVGLDVDDAVAELESLGSVVRAPRRSTRSSLPFDRTLKQIKGKNRVGVKRNHVRGKVTVTDDGSPMKRQPLSPDFPHHQPALENSNDHDSSGEIGTPLAEEVAGPIPIDDDSELLKEDSPPATESEDASKEGENTMNEDGNASNESENPVKESESSSSADTTNSSEEEISATVDDVSAPTNAQGDASSRSQSDEGNVSTPQRNMRAKFSDLGLSGRRSSARQIEKEEEEQERIRLEKEREAAEENARLAKLAAEEQARKEKEAEEERRKNGFRRIPKEKVIQPLDTTWDSRVDQAMAQASGQQMATTSTGTALSRKDFGTLLPQPGRDPRSGWLNDEIIMAYLQAVVDHGLSATNHQQGETPKFHAFNTFFFKNVQSKGVQSVKRWATKAKIGGKSLESVERVFIPVHSGLHWTLLVVSPIARTIEYFDSLGGARDSYVAKAKDWLEQEMGKAWNAEEWAVLDGNGGPRQDNGSDCGVFTVTTAKMILLGVDPMTYSCTDIPLQRKRMTAELMNGGFTGDFTPKVEFE